MQTDSRKWEVGYAQNIPYNLTTGSTVTEISWLARECHDVKRDLDRVTETRHAFTRPALPAADKGRMSGCEAAHIRLSATHPLQQRFLAWLTVNEAAEVQIVENSYRIDQAVLDLYEIAPEDRRTIDRELGPHSGAYPRKETWSEEEDEKLRQVYLSSSRDLEALAHALQVHPASVAARRQTLGLGSGQALGLCRPAEFAGAVADLICYCVGCLFGRWDIRVGAGEVEPLPLPDPEEGLPLYAPGMMDAECGTTNSAFRIPNSAFCRTTPATPTTSSPVWRPAWPTSSARSGCRRCGQRWKRPWGAALRPAQGRACGCGWPATSSPSTSSATPDRGARRPSTGSSPSPAGVTPCGSTTTPIAFANADGGRLLIGIEDDGTVSGLDPVANREQVERLLRAAENIRHRHFSRNPHIVGVLKTWGY